MTVTRNITHRQIGYAESKRKIQNTTGITAQGLIQVINEKIMNNCPINRQSVSDALHIFGPSIANLQGKNTRYGQDHITLEHIAPIPPIILQHHKNIVIDMDIVKIHSVRFLVTYSRTVTFCTAT